MSKQSSRKEKKQAAQDKASRQKMVRFGGLAVIILIVIVGLIGWGRADKTLESETAVLAPPHLDGPADAPVKVVEYADLTCSSCRQWHNTGVKEQLQAEFGDQISFEYRHFPVITVSSPRWAEAAQCAAEQGLFWPFHDYVYENFEPYPTVNSDRLQEIGAAIGLESEAFNRCLDSGRYRKFVTDAIQRAQNDGARGTPTFFVNSQPVFPSYEAMSETIRGMLNN
ncbi:MAG: thioredoxin domain-containing protein [Anaerolinea sp.]|nr:thioredoxin domain-containing protein [Anaerolinea sp.]